ncbi:MAG: arsenic resistance protein [Desulfobacterales bacterium]|nr:MAG: arsenic resistance protein [Desulfobacterales bacterium]UCD90738.1 MAG: arsenic resistance protein [Desulfobacterales bacterium]
MSREEGLCHLDKLQPFILISSVFLGIFLGTIFPEFAHYSDAILYVIIIVLVYSVMLGVPHQKIWKAYRNWRFFGIAWFVNFVIIPLMAWGLAALFLSSYPPIYVGFILYLVTPCTDWFLVFTLMAGGDVPLALALLPTNLILQVVLIPVYLILFAGEIVSFQFRALIETMLIFILLPFICAGLTRLFLRKLKDADWARDFIEKILSPLQSATLTMVLLTMFAGQTFTILDNIGPLSIVFVPLVVFFLCRLF